MLLHWFSHSAQELSQCLGLRQPCLATFSGPWAHTILQWGWMFILLLYGVHEVIFLICYLSPAKGWDFFSQDVMVFCYPAGRKVTICVCYLSQSYSNDEHSPEPRDMLRSSPSRSHRHSVGFVPTVYNGTLPPSEFLRFLHKHARNTIIQSPPLSLPWWYVCSVRFSPPGSGSLPRCDCRDEESSVHGAQSPCSYQQLSICRLPDLSPAHPHQVTPSSTLYRLLDVYVKGF